MNFSRPIGDIEKSLAAIPRANSSDIVEKYKRILKIEVHLYDPIAKDKLENQCKEF
jgi:hypothetical protein